MELSCEPVASLPRLSSRRSSNSRRIKLRVIVSCLLSHSLILPRDSLHYCDNVKFTSMRVETSTGSPFSKVGL